MHFFILEPLKCHMIANFKYMSAVMLEYFLEVINPQLAELRATAD